MKYIRKYKLEILGILAFLLIMLYPNTLKSQIMRDSAGNFYSAVKSEPVLTKLKYYDRKNRIIYPVYINSKGKYFVYKVSGTTGKKYQMMLQ